MGLRVKLEKGVLTFEPGSKERRDTLIVNARYGEFSATRKFPLTVTADHPVVKRISSKDGMDWGYARRGGKETPGSSPSADPASGACCYDDEIPVGGVMKRGLFMHPPWTGGATGYTYGITSPITMPDKPCEFRTFIGLKDGGDASDGVTFKVLVLDDTGKELPLLSDHYAAREWKELVADLSAFRGKTIRLKLISDAGPNDNCTADWASWGDPRVVETRPVMRVDLR
jgi:hypothetical protein